jgi:hypothetical protein
MQPLSSQGHAKHPSRFTAKVYTETISPATFHSAPFLERASTSLQNTLTASHRVRHATQNLQKQFALKSLVKK